MVQITDASADATEGAPVAFVLPGGGYTAQAPLLYWPVGLLRATGWRVFIASWGEGDRSHTSPEELIDDALGMVFSRASTIDLIVAKSLGTFALPPSVDRGIAGVWLTPLLNIPSIAAALSRADSRHLAVGGSADRHWNPKEIHGTDASLLEIEGADHALLTPDWRESMREQSRVLDRIADHVAAVRPD